MKTAAAILVLAFCASSGRSEPPAAKPRRPPFWPLLINGFAYPKMELALTDAERERGLMLRQEIPTDGGMIFVFNDDLERSFWMKYTLAPLDIVFLDSNSTVVAIHHMPTEAPRRDFESDGMYERRLAFYPSYKKARIAIEFAAGQSDLCGIKVGDVIDIGMYELQQLAKDFADDE